MLSNLKTLHGNELLDNFEEADEVLKNYSTFIERRRCAYITEYLALHHVWMSMKNLEFFTVWFEN